MDAASQRERAIVRFVMEHARGPVFVIDRAGAVVEMNRAARERGADLAELFDATVPHRAIERLLRALSTPDAAAETEHSRTAGDGTTRHLRLSGANLEGLFVIAVEDVSDRRDLEREVEALRRVESLGMLTASLVHDLNNLLTPVLVLSGVALRAVSGTGVEPQLRDLQASAKRASELVRDLLALGQPRPAVTQRVDVSELVSELAPVMERLLGERATLTLSLAPDLPEVSIERARLEHALLNLVANARDAAPGGQVTIRTAIGRDGADGPSVVVAVVDDGSGMSEPVRARAFDRSFTTKPTGLGLGLASVYAFVRDSAGTVNVESAPGHGTTIAIELPAERPARGRRVSGAVPTQASAGGVLVVDPDAAVRGAARAALEARGLYVLDVASLAEALALARTLSVEVALIDLTLAREDPRFTERLRAEAPRARVVWMTGDAEPSPRPRGPILRKAFSEAELVRAVRDVLATDQSA